MQSLVPVDTIPQVLAPIRDVVTEPQFVQIERLGRDTAFGVLVEAKRTIEAVRQALTGGTGQFRQPESLSGRVALVSLIIALAKV